MRALFISGFDIPEGMADNTLAMLSFTIAILSIAYVAANYRVWRKNRDPRSIRVNTFGFIAIFIIAVAQGIALIMQ